MAKVIINEERLNTIIEEAITEVMIEEGLFGNMWNGIKNGANRVKNFVNDHGGLAGAAGALYQRARNGINNAAKNFEFGRASERAKNQDYDPLQNYVQKYGTDFAQKMVNNLGDKYGQNRYNKMSDVRQGKTIPGANTDPDEPTANPVVQAANAPQQNKLNFGGNQQTKQNVANKAQQILQQKAMFLKQKGFQLVNGQWIYTKDGSNSPALQSQYPDIVQAAKSYNMALKGAKGLYEAKLKKLSRQLNEIKGRFNKGVR